MAKQLYLVRHAKSSWSDMSLHDFERPLNRRGLRDAPEMGRRLKQRGISPEIVLCSSALRARQTAELLLPELGVRQDSIVFKDCVYEASVEILTDLIRRQPNDCGSVMLIGHNPAIGLLAGRLADRHVERMPTCAAVCLELETDQWDRVLNCASRLIDFDYPKRDRNDD